MANRYAVASGNWSNTATWDGGTLPTSADVVRPNNFSVTIDQDITVQALRNDATAPSVAGGTFTLTGNYTVNISIDIQCFATNLFIYNGTGTAYIIGANTAAAIISSTTTNNTATVTHSGIGTLVVDMVINSGVNSELNRANIQVIGGGTLNCLQDIRKLLTADSTNITRAIFITTTDGAILNLKNIWGSRGSSRVVETTVRCTINIVGDIKGGISSTGSSPSTCLYITGPNTILNILGNVFANPSIQTGVNNGILINSTCTLNIIGNVFGGTTSTGNSQIAISLFSPITSTISGNIYGGSSGVGSSNSSAISTNSGFTNLTIIGDIFGGSGAGTVAGIFNTSAASSNINITGNLTGGSNGIAISSGGNINITGNVIGGSGNSALSISTAIVVITGTIIGGSTNGVVGVNINGNLNHIGIAQASAFGSAISCNAPTTSTIICTGPFLRNGYIVAVASQTLRINALYNPYFEFRKSDTTNVTYVDQSTSNFPVIANVRQGTSYASGLYTGALAVPDPSNVRKGVATDDTVGTADLTAEDMWNYLTSNTFASGSMGDRMKNVSTVASTGAQIASYSV